MKIIVIGETCKDIFVYSDTNRMSPEAPVPVIVPVEIKHNSGMSGNVVKNVEVIDNKISIVHWHQKEIITKTRHVDKKSNHMYLRIDEGENNIEPLYLNVSKKNALKNVDLVVVSDYDKGFLSLETLLEIGKLSKLSILDSKKQLTKEIVNSFSFVKLNESEAKKNIHLKECNNIIVTLGSKGAMFDGKLYESPNPKETIDVSGAGDTFTASFILAYHETKDVEKSIIFANDKSSIVVSKRGVATP